jgi:glycosyltransferase involved in cell wall biosynthesis
MKVIVVTSHPIQYQVPVFRHLAAMPDIELTVLFAMIPDAAAQGSGFGVAFEWDIPLLEGYPYQVLKNVAATPSVAQFFGCDTPGIFQVLKQLQPDAVIVNGWVVKTCLQALWTCKRLGIPCLVRGEANNLRQRPAWKRWLQRLLLHQYAACLYIGEQNRVFYASLGVPERKLFPAFYCIENERFARSATQLRESRQQLRMNWHIAPDATCFLFCGKFEAKKHPLELLDAFRAAQPSTHGLHLLMVGDGALRAQCEAVVARYHLPVTFTGFLNQSEIIRAYVAADCLVLPSDAGETWGLVVNEAMACGLPAIVSDLVGCAADLVVFGQTGETFAFGDWAGLSALIGKYSEDRIALQRMGANARERIASYSPQAVADEMAAAVAAVLARRATGQQTDCAGSPAAPGRE